jgi:hypothetical protein
MAGKCTKHILIGIGTKEMTVNIHLVVTMTKLILHAQEFGGVLCSAVRVLVRTERQKVRQRAQARTVLNIRLYGRSTGVLISP